MLFEICFIFCIMSNQSNLICEWLTNEWLKCVWAAPKTLGTSTSIYHKSYSDGLGFRFFFSMLTGSVHIPMHMSTCQHHPATTSTSFSQKLPPKNESFPARSNTLTSSNGHRTLHHHPQHHQHPQHNPQIQPSRRTDGGNSPIPALISSNLNSFKNNSALGAYNNDDISNSADSRFLSWLGPLPAWRKTNEIIDTHYSA